MAVKNISVSWKMNFRVCMFKSNVKNRNYLWRLSRALLVSQREIWMNETRLVSVPSSIVEKARKISERKLERTSGGLCHSLFSFFLLFPVSACCILKDFFRSFSTNPEGTSRSLQWSKLIVLFYNVVSSAVDFDVSIAYSSLFSSGDDVDCELIVW